MAKNNIDPTLPLLTDAKQYFKWRTNLASVLLTKGLWDYAFLADLETELAFHKRSSQHRLETQQTAG